MSKIIDELKYDGQLLWQPEVRYVLLALVIFVLIAALCA